ncbi:phototropic-responsive NPH3 family protein NPY2-like isoform X2 [Aristolochia californica]
MTVTLNAYNVVAARCAAEYLEMNESVEKGNLIFKIEVFLNSSVLRSWKDSIIVLQTTKSLLRWCEDLKIIGRCIESIASKASIDTLKVQWSYTYNRKKLPSENGAEQWNGVRKQQTVPKDWWVEDLSELEIDFYKRVIMTIKTKGLIPSEVVGESLKAYAFRRVPGFSEGTIPGGDIAKYRSLIETLIWLLPSEKGCVSCSFLFKLLKAASLLDSGEMTKRVLVKRIGQQLEEASVKDLLIPAPSGEDAIYDVDLVQNIVEEFLVQEQNVRTSLPVVGDVEEIRSPSFVSGASKLAVAKLVDGYLAEIARDPNLPVSKFIDLAEMVSSDSRPVHDGLYRAIDMYLKEHPGLGKTEKKKICRLMDCKKLSMDACMHAAQNERLPLRVVVQVLFFEQVRAATTSGARVPDIPSNIRALLPHENGGSHGSSRSATTNTDEDWDGSNMVEPLKGVLTSMRLSEISDKSEKGSKSKGGIFKPKKILNKIWSNKGSQQGENSSSDTSKSPGSGSVNPDEIKSTPSRNRRHSVS